LTNIKKKGNDARVGHYRHESVESMKVIKHSIDNIIKRKYIHMQTWSIISIDVEKKKYNIHQLGTYSFYLFIDRIRDLILIYSLYVVWQEHCGWDSRHS